jgi:hypothetical protein
MATSEQVNLSATQTLSNKTLGSGCAISNQVTNGVVYATGTTGLATTAAGSGTKTALHVSASGVPEFRKINPYAKVLAMGAFIH